MFQLTVKDQDFPCVVFDVDGVLGMTFVRQYDSFGIVVNNNKWLAERFEKKFVGRKFNFDTFNKQCNGRARPEQIRNLFDLDDDKLTQEQVDDISKQKDTEYQKFKDNGQIEKYDHMEDLLKKLVKHNIPIGFFSGSTSAAEVVEIIGLLDYFDIGIFPHPSSKVDENGRIHAYVKPKEVPGQTFTFEKGFPTKSNEAGYIKCAEKLGFLNQKFLGVEDAANVAGKKLRLMEVAYVGPLEDLEEFEHKPLLACETHEELVEKLISSIKEVEYTTQINATLFNPEGNGASKDESNNPSPNTSLVIDSPENNLRQ